MADKKVSLSVEKLDNGYIVTENRKSNAIESRERLLDMLNTRLENLVKASLNYKDISSFYLSIDIIENPPKSA
jgi:hypothetical protein